MRVLALDPATKCGWAVWSNAQASPFTGYVVAAGTWDLSIRRDESSGMRLIRLRGKLSEISRAEKLDLVVFEAARNAGPKMQGALVVQAELQGVIKLWCEGDHLPYKGYSPTEIKRAATGKGNANKQAMLEAARLKWPDFKGDDNEADARWLAELAGRAM